MVSAHGSRYERKHANIGEYNGTYFETKNAAPFEHWLAEQMDLITTYEKDKYN